MFSKIILASQSPRRKQLLEWAEIPFEVIVKPTDETFPEGMPAEEVAIHIAHNKAEIVRRSLSEEKKQYPVLAADTIVVLKNKIIGKPTDRKDAIDILTALSANKHKVITGVVISKGHRTVSFADTTEVKFHLLTKSEIEFYVDKYKPYDKAGAYAIQEWIGVIGIKSINGDFYNVMGLPVSRVVKELNKIK
jgi:septum formation protein